MWLGSLPALPAGAVLLGFSGSELFGLTSKPSDVKEYVTQYKQG